MAARLIFAMSQSLDGYVASPTGALEPPLGPPGETLFSRFVEHERNLTGSIYGRRIYEMLRYWDDDRPEWTALERDFALAWRAHPKWVVSRTLKEVGPNATLVDRDIEPRVRQLKSEMTGDIAVAGPQLAATLTGAGLVDEYHLYLRPVVLGAGIAYFSGTRPRIRCIATERIGDEAVLLKYEALLM